MTESSLPPSSGDDAPIDAEFEPAVRGDSEKVVTKSGPGWFAFGLVGLVSAAGFALAAASAGYVPGFNPGAGTVQKLENEHPVPYSVYIETEEWQIISQSPELFLEKKGQNILSKPMKGTIQRGLTYAEDEKLRRKYLKRADKGVERLIYIVKDLDMITKLEAGDLRLNIESFDIVDLVRNVFELLEMKASKKNITLAFDQEYEHPIMVKADKEKIQQVLSNLVVNSIKYGHDNGTTEPV